MTSCLTAPYHWLRYGSPLKADETVVLFPQSAAHTATGGWDIPLPIWVVELEQSTAPRHIGQRAMLEILQLANVVDDEQTLSATYRERIICLMADREMNKRFKVRLDRQTFTTPRSPINGHIKFTAHYTGNAAAGSALPHQLTSDLASDIP